MSDAILHRAAAATHSSTEAGEEKSRNDYVIDELVATILCRKLLFDNSADKMKEALRDIEFTDFADSAQKAGEMAYIYSQLAMLSELKENRLMLTRQMANIEEAYVDIVVYQTAAAKLRKSALNEHLACYGYAQLKFV